MSGVTGTVARTFYLFGTFKILFLMKRLRKRLVENPGNGHSRRLTFEQVEFVLSYSEEDKLNIFFFFFKVIPKGILV